MDTPILLGSLLVELFIFGQELLVVLGELSLEVKVLLIGRFGLLLQKLILHRG
jgi:hypothetical protein